MTKKTMLVLALSCAAAAFTFGQAFSVDYLDGAVELKTAKGWDSLSIGDEISAGATVRVSQNGTLQLSRGAKRLSILADGVYTLSDIQKAGEKGGGMGLGTSISQKIRSLTRQKEKSTAAGGVRGEQKGTDDLQWAEESDETRAKAKKLLAEGKYKDTVPALIEAIRIASSAEDKQELQYLLASAYYGLGENARAYRALSQSAPDATAGYYPDFIILKAEVLLDSFAFKEGLAMLGGFISSKPEKEYAQIAYFLSARCSRGLGDEKAAKEALTAGYALDPKSETAKLISEMQNK